LDAKKVVLIDRYYYSTAAYQGAIGFDPQKICADNEAFAPVPDRVFLLQGSLDQSFKRIEEGRDAFSSFEKEDYLKKVQSIFDTFQAPHIKRINSDPSVDEVHAEMVREVNELLKMKELS